MVPAQERQDAKEREQLRNQVLKDRTALRATTLELQGMKKERDNLSSSLADTRMTLDSLRNKLLETQAELTLLKKASGPVAVWPTPAMDECRAEFSAPHPSPAAGNPKTGA